MRSLLRTDPLLRNVLALCAAGFVIGLSYGAIATAAGFPLSQIAAMSALVYAGGAQFLALGIVGAGGSAVAVVLAGLLLNARHLPFGLAIGAETVGRSWPARLAGSHLMTDESVAFALAQRDPAERRRAYWLTGVALFISWNTSSLIGAVAGSAFGEPEALGIDAAFPAALLALLLPSLREKPALRVALAAVVVALVATPFLPAGLPVLVALLGLVFALPVPARLRAAR